MEIGYIMRKKFKEDIMENLRLFVLPQCPYCNKVRDYLKDKDFDVEIVDVNVPENQDELMRVGGQDMVPCLFIDGKPLYESGDIIQWFKDRE